MALTETYAPPLARGVASRRGFRCSPLALPRPPTVSTRPRGVSCEPPEWSSDQSVPAPAGICPWPLDQSRAPFRGSYRPDPAHDAGGPTNGSASIQERGGTASSNRRHSFRVRQITMQIASCVDAPLGVRQAAETSLRSNVLDLPTPVGAGSRQFRRQARWPRRRVPNPSIAPSLPGGLGRAHRRQSARAAGGGRGRRASRAHGRARGREPADGRQPATTRRPSQARSPGLR